MNRATFTVGIVMVGVAILVLILRFQSASVREAVAAIQQGATSPQAVTRFTVGVVLPIVLPFALGIAFLILGLMGRAPSWFGR